MTIDKKPLVSIIIPVFNGADYMREAIDSAINQTYKNCEIIIVNDGSSDHGETERIALSYGKAVRYFYKENGGVSSALNYGIRKMRGYYFSWLSHDDIYDKDKVKKQIEAAERHHDTDAAVLCGISYIGGKSGSRCSSEKKRSLPEGKVCSWPAVLMDLVKNGSFYGCGLLIPRHMIEECGGFREDLRYCQDYLMWLQLFTNENRLIYQKEKLTSLRIHDKQLTQTGRDLYHKEAKTAAREIVPKLVKLSSRKRNYLFYFARDHARYNNPEILNYCFHAADRKKLFTLADKIYLNGYLVYGKLRPVIRKLYYRLFWHVNTQ